MPRLSALDTSLSMNGKLVLRFNSEVLRTQQSDLTN